MSISGTISLITSIGVYCIESLYIVVSLYSIFVSPGRYTYLVVPQEEIRAHETAINIVSINVVVI